MSLLLHFAPLLDPPPFAPPTDPSCLPLSSNKPRLLARLFVCVTSIYNNIIIRVCLKTLTTTADTAPLLSPCLICSSLAGWKREEAEWSVREDEDDEVQGVGGLEKLCGG